MTRQPTDGFREAVKNAWGNPERVADVGINESFSHDEVFSFDHDDQVDTAKRIGVLAGQTFSDGPNAFVKAFTYLLNEPED